MKRMVYSIFLAVYMYIHVCSNAFAQFQSTKIKLIRQVKNSVGQVVEG